MAEKQAVRVAWLSGPLRKRKEILQKIKTSLGDHELMDCDESCGFDYLEQQVLSQDCFDAKRLVMVTAMPQPVGSTKETMKNHLKKLLDKVPESCLVLFYGIPADDEKMISQYVAKLPHGKVMSADQKVPQPEAERYVMQRLVEAEKQADRSDVNKFVSMLEADDKKNYDVDELDRNVEKLIAYVGKKKSVTLEDVRTVSVPADQTNIWKLFDMIDAKEFEAAHEAVQSMMASGEGVDKVVSYQILPLFMWRYRLLFVLKEAQAQGLNQDQVVAKVCAFEKIKQEGLGFNMRVTSEGKAYNEYMVSRTLGGNFGSVLDNYTKPKLFKIVNLLQAIMDQTRQLKREAEFKILMDMLLMLACDKIDDNNLAKMWRYFDSE